MPSPAASCWIVPVSSDWDAVAAGETSSPTDAARDFSALDDAALAREAGRGARAAFDVIVERHGRSVYKLCFRFVGNHEDAADLAQDVFVRAWRALPRFRGQASVATWLYRIGVNVCLNHAAARKQAADPIDPLRHQDQGAADPADAALRAERGRHVRAAIARLPRRQRSVLILRVYQELPHRDIARVLGSSPGAVKANFFHALTNLKRLLSEP